MLLRRIVLVLMSLFASGTALAAGESDLKIRAFNKGTAVTIEQIIQDGKVVVSVSDAAKKPVFGLGTADFSVKQSGRTAKISSVQPMSENKDVPRHIVLVMDNSYSMYQRKATRALLAGVSELLKTVRPIDDVRMVVFDNKKTVNVDGRELHVQIFGSNQPDALKEFAGNAYQIEGLTGGTVLNEALLAGIDIIRKMPAQEPRFMVVFSDGEDLNSAFGQNDVFQAAKGLDHVNVYAIDYMERTETDRFLTRLARDNNGQIWKAKSETNIVPIFQSVASRMQYYYVVNFQFPPTGSVAVSPVSLKLDEISSMGTVLPVRINSGALTLRPVVDSVYGIARWKAVVSNSRGAVAELAGIGAPATELSIPLPTADLRKLSDYGDLVAKMELEDNKGQTLTLTALPVSIKRAQTRAGLSVAPAGLVVEEIRNRDTSLISGIDSSTLKLTAALDRVDWIAGWKAVVSNSRGTVAELSGEGAPAAGLTVALPSGDLKSLVDNGALTVRMELKGRTGQSLILAAAPVTIKRVQARASLAVVPASLTVDTVSVMGAAPAAMINSSALTVRPAFDSAGWIARWKLIVSNSGGTVAELAGQGPPAAELKIALPGSDLPALAAKGDLAVRMVVENRIGQSLALNAAPVRVRLVQTRANLAVAPSSLKIEEIKTIDASPLLGHIYFVKGAAEIPPQYVRLGSPADTAGFDEQKFSGTLEKYYQDLNIIGKRLTDKSEATITLVGCNDNAGKEKGNRKLSSQRATAVRDYLQTVWKIAPERMTLEARNLPAKPSSIHMKEGQAENRRVEILSTDPSILAPIRSTYVTTRIDNSSLVLRPEVSAPNGIASWKLVAANGSGTLLDQTGKGAPAREIPVPLGSGDLKALALGGDITVKMEMQDGKGQQMQLAPEPVKVNFIQTSQRLAQKQDLLVQEKYALILFDFNKDTIEGQNQQIINNIVKRITSLPQATVEIVGHTDNIGKEKYNLKLSERRALSVYKMLTAAYGEPSGNRIRHSGVGPNNPLFDNQSPEARSFNRTVTITLEYLSKE